MEANGKSGLRVLVADDSSIIRQALRRLLESYGDHVIAEASNGREALHLVDQNVPDVALIDLRMPELDGFATIHAIRTLYPNVVIIAMSLDESREVTLRLQKQGVAYLSKESVCEVLESVLPMLDSSTSKVAPFPELSPKVAAA